MPQAQPIGAGARLREWSAERRGPAATTPTYARRLLQHFLVPPLDGAVALVEVDRVAVGVGKHLDLDVPGAATASERHDPSGGLVRRALEGSKKGRRRRTAGSRGTFPRARGRRRTT